MAGTPKAGTLAVTAADRQRQALELRKAGHTFESIAGHLGFNDKSAARKSVMRALHAVVAEPAEELRTLMLEQHRTMLKAIWPEVVRGNLKAIDRAIRILSAIADLEGVNAPVKVNVELMVRTAAEELGLSTDEQARLHSDIEDYIKAGVA